MCVKITLPRSLCVRAPDISWYDVDDEFGTLLEAHCVSSEAEVGMQLLLIR